MLASWPAASQSSIFLITMVTPCSKKRGLCPPCLHGGEWFWARKESRTELSRHSKEAVLTPNLSQHHLIHTFSRDRQRFGCVRKTAYWTPTSIYQRKRLVEKWVQKFPIEIDAQLELTTCGKGQQSSGKVLEVYKSVSQLTIWVQVLRDLLG